jgi:hypothetical protein
MQATVVVDHGRTSSLGKSASRTVTLEASTALDTLLLLRQLKNEN